MKKSVFDDTGLKVYRAKRNFQETREPKPKRVKTARKKHLRFVIQKHDASRLHFDFRLEMGGVLKSWAVPKGIPLQLGEKHLAIHVEDHPLDYTNFEGTIPDGNYGAGTVMVWDAGTYEVIGENPLEALRAGKLHFQLTGKKLNGEWALIHLKPRAGEKESWLIFKAGENAKSLTQKKAEESALSGRSMEIIASENKAQWTKHRRVAQSRKPSKTSQKNTEEKLRFVEPMKCKPLKTPPQGKDWIYEVKFDGFRTIAIKKDNEVELFSRSQKKITERFPEIAEAVQRLPCRTGIFDGEIVALDKEGRSSFQLLQAANMPGETRAPLCFYVFDLLNLDGIELAQFPLVQRKKVLQSLIEKGNEPVRFSAGISGDPAKLLEEIRRRGMDGIIAKNKSSKYEAGKRTGSWAKIKVINEQEFVIGGYTTPKGTRDYFGAILVGYFKNGKFIFASKVGSGFNQAVLLSLHREFQKIKQAKCPFENLPEKRGRYGQGVTPAEMKRCTWLKPKMVAQIKFTEWTREDRLRHPVFTGLREDKKATSVVKEATR